ncbi:MAG: KH domain-containing protein [Ignavibacteriales bacterium]|jgi:RNA-binding protein (KH domain)|nr:MAG: KH domain-containing protein [Ignavibacteriaceae bacterium]MBW7873972.1 KH domain-containing protein [Ignavibacteria bacterium]MCZ2143270.1 KH domain-containing protein [Ignavibacteriales bacterium]OQY77252.1 MAG: RNA-binding protein [Ignavibacteriales bacterium UTCHB3]MBV6444151.1 hypothetical protein [Ignavibacteriaceae bacterium]
MKEFVEYIAKCLVDLPDKVVVEVRAEEENKVVFALKVEPNDIGKIIGKKGRTAVAIRTLLTAVAAKEGKRAFLEIID